MKPALRIFLSTNTMKHPLNTHNHNKGALCLALFGIFILSLLRLSAATQIEVVASKSYLRPGEGSEILVYASNPDNFAHTDIDVDFTMPTGFSSSTGSATPGLTKGFSGLTPGEEVGWTIPLLNPGEVRLLRIMVFAQSGGSALADGASASFTMSALRNGSIEDTAAVSLVVQSQQALEFAASVQTISSALNVPYEMVLTYGNRGVTPLTNVTLEFDLPNQHLLVSATTVPTQVGAQLTWNVGTVNPGETGQIQLQLQRTGNFPAATLLPLEMTASGGGETQVYGIVLAPGAASPLQSTIAHGGLPMGLDDDAAETTLSLINDGSFAQTNAEIRFIIPSFLRGDTSWSDMSMAAGFSNLTTGELAGWDKASLAAKKADHFRTQFRPASASSGLVVSLIFCTLSDNGSLAVSTLAIPIQSAPTLDLELSSHDTSVIAGKDYCFTLLLGNRSASLLSNVRPKLFLPKDVFGNIQLTGGQGTLNGDVLTWNALALPPGEVRKLAVTARALSSATTADFATKHLGGLMVAVAEDAGTNTPSAIASFPLQVAENQSIDLNVSMVKDQWSGELTEVTLAVTNPSSFTLTDSRLDILVPEGALSNTVWMLPAPTRGFSNITPSEVIGWDIASIAPGQTQFYHLGMRAEDVAGISRGSVVPLAAVLRNANGNDVAQLNVGLPPAVDSRLSMTAETLPVAPGDITRFSVGYGNRSSLPLTSCRLTVQLPRGLEFLFGDDGLVHQDDLSFPAEHGGTITILDNGTLAPHVAHEAVFYVRTPAATAIGAVFPLKATLTSSESLTTSTVDLPVSNPIPLNVGIATTGDPLSSDLWTEYQLTASNTGASSLSNIEMSFLFPSWTRGNTSVSTPGLARGFSNLASGEITGWDTTLLPAGGVRHFRTWMTSADDSIADGTVGQIMARSSASDGSQVISSINQAFMDDARLDVALVAKRHTSPVEGTIEAEIVVGNRSTQALGQTTLRLDLPGELLAVSDPSNQLPPVVGNAMRWVRGSMPPGGTVVIPVTLQWRPGVSAGTQANLCVHARSGNSNGTASLLLHPQIPVQHELDLVLAPNAETLNDNEIRTITATVTNGSSFGRNSVRVDYFVPNGFGGQFANGNPPMDFGFSNLTASERVGWVRTLASAQMEPLNLPLTFAISDSVRAGSVISVAAGIWEASGASDLSSFAFRLASTDVSFSPVDPNASPDAADVDDDGILDVYETGTGIYLSAFDTGTDPAKADSDGDGIEDGDESEAAFLDPNHRHPIAEHEGA